MISSISKWAEGIIIAVIICTIIEMILPEGKNKKYIKIVIGIYILFTVISPIISKINGKNIDNTINEYKNYLKTDNYEVKETSATNVSLNNTYMSNLKEDIKKRIKERGYQVENLDVEIEVKDNEKYGSLKKIEMQIKKENKVAIVNEVKIKVDSKESQREENSITEEEKNELKNFLNNTYEIKTEDIQIIG